MSTEEVVNDVLTEVALPDKEAVVANGAAAAAPPGDNDDDVAREVVSPDRPDAEAMAEIAAAVAASVAIPPALAATGAASTISPVLALSPSPRRITAPALSDANYFGIDVGSLRIDRYTASSSGGDDAGRSAAAAAAAELELELSLLPPGELYRAPLPCPLLPPEDPPHASAIAVGADDATTAREARRHAAVSERRARVRARVPPSTLAKIATWQRWTAISAHRPGAPAAHLFEPTAGPSFDPPPPQAAALSQPQGSGAAFDVLAATAGGGATLHALQCQRPALLPEAAAHQPFLPQFSRGVFADEPFLLAVACVAADRALFSGLFAGADALDRGALQFRFFDDDPAGTAAESGAAAPLALPRPVPVFVTIDTQLPVTKTAPSSTAPADLHLAVGRTACRDEYWLAFLASAYAAFRGSFAEALDGPDASVVLRHLTGGTAAAVEWDRARVSAAAKDELWWRLQQATALGEPMLLTRRSGAPAGGDGLTFAALPPGRGFEPAPGASAADDWAHGAVCFFAAQYDANREARVDWYRRAQERRASRLPFDDPPHRLVKLRVALRGAPAAAAAAGGEWRRGSERWGAPEARLALGQPAEADEGAAAEAAAGLVWWMTLDELAAHFTTLVVVSNVDGTDAATRAHHAPPCGGPRDLALTVPHFQVAVRKLEAAAAGGGDAAKSGGEIHASLRREAESIDPSFRSVFDLRPGRIALGDETDDERESRSALSASSRSSIADLAAINPHNSLGVEFRVAMPPAALARCAWTLQLYRVPAPGKQPVHRLFRDGVVTHALPVQGLVASKFLSRDGCALFFEADLNTGFYNVVVQPDTVVSPPSDYTGVSAPILLTTVKRGNAELFDLSVERLP